MRKLILDTSCLTGTPKRHLLELARNFKSSVSYIALLEAWARSVREGSLPKFRSRLRGIAEFLDLSDPIVPTGSQLFLRLGGRISGASLIQPEPDFDLAMRQVWEQLVDPAVPDSSLEPVGSFANKEIDALARDWNSDDKNLTHQVRSDIAAFPREVAVLRIGFHLAAEHSRSVSLPSGLQERLNLYFRLTALFAYQRVTSAEVRFEDNDSEDVQLLMHLADDVILTTADARLIERVDQTRSYQAPYVRTVPEILTGQLPEGPPWGRQARRASKHHAPRTRKQLNELAKSLA